LSGGAGVEQTRPGSIGADRILALSGDHGYAHHQTLSHISHTGSRSKE